MESIHCLTRDIRFGARLAPHPNPAKAGLRISLTVGEKILNINNMINKSKLLKILLVVSAIYFFIAAFCHFFGWTIFPFYDGNLYTPYHDTLLALSDLIFVLIFLAVAKNPEKNIDILNVIIIGFFLALIFNLGIIWKIDFMLLESPAKKEQTIFETMLTVFILVSLILLKPKSSDKKF